jgi:hypothetical protein
VWWKFFILSLSFTLPTFADRVRLQPQKIPKDLIFNQFQQKVMHSNQLLNVEFRHFPESLVLNKEAALTASVSASCDVVNYLEFMVDMPSHGHGLADGFTLKKMQITEPGGRTLCRFFIQEAHFHMPGWWRFCVLKKGSEPKNNECFHRLILK